MKESHFSLILTLTNKRDNNLVHQRSFRPVNMETGSYLNIY